MSSRMFSQLVTGFSLLLQERGERGGPDVHDHPDSRRHVLPRYRYLPFINIPTVFIFRTCTVYIITKGSTRITCTVQENVKVFFPVHSFCLLILDIFLFSTSWIPVLICRISDRKNKPDTHSYSQYTACPVFIQFHKLIKPVNTFFNIFCLFIFNNQPGAAVFLSPLEKRPATHIKLEFRPFLYPVFGRISG